MILMLQKNICFELIRKTLPEIALYPGGIWTSGLLLKGLIIGFSVAAPVGPISVLCIRRTLAEGRVSGLVSGIGAATADATYGFIAGFGMIALLSLRG